MTPDILLAMIAYSNDAHVWRLRMPVTPENPNGRMIEIDGFSGSLANETDAMKIDGILRSMGYIPALNQWRTQDGAIVIPVVRNAAA